MASIPSGRATSGLPVNGSVGFFGDLNVFVREGLFGGEQVEGVYCKGEVVLTNRRLIMLEPVAPDRTALISVPFGSVSSVAFLSPAGGSIVSSTTLEIKAGRSVYVVDVGGERGAREVHDRIMWHLIGR